MDTDTAERLISLGCGVAAAAAASAATNPLECVRVRYQVADVHTYKMKGKSVIKSPTSLFSFGLSIVRNEGYLRGLHLCGLSGWIASMSCAFGARMAMYDPVRGAINRLCGTSNSGTAFAAGLCTGALSNFAACPLFLAKTRIQAAAGPGVVDNTLLAELAAVQRAGGLAAQYAGSQALLLRGGCIAGGNMWGYDLGKRALKAHGHEEGPLFHAACSAFSAVTASVLAAPADLVLNRFHAATARGARSPFTSIGACALAVVRNDGVAALFRGVGANFVKMAPTFLGTLPLYEQFRRLAGLGYLQT